MSNADDDIDFELILNPNQLAAPPAMQTETVILKDWKTQSGKAAGFKVWELTASDYDTLIRSGWTFNPDGTRKQYSQDDQEIRLLAFCVRDPSGHRLWKTVEDAAKQLRPLGKATFDQLVLAANRVNSVKIEDSEGNSDGTPNDSSPTT